MNHMHYEEFSDLCSQTLELLLQEEDLTRLNTPRNQFSMQRMLGFFETHEEYEACQDLQEIALQVFGHKLQPVDTKIIYETETKA